MSPCTPVLEHVVTFSAPLTCVEAPSLAAGRDLHPIVHDLSACGPSVNPATLRAIIRVESGGNPLAINVNHATSQPPPPADAVAAAALAGQWMRRGYSVDLGLMQVNSGNLASLGYSIAEMFDPCKNIAAGATILTADYLAARRSRPDDQQALEAALSAYNTGSFERGFVNGYVQRYFGPVAIAPAPANTSAVHASLRPNPYTADPTVYTRAEDAHD